ncbi:hypothetical protein YT28_03150 [Salmonella enterica subsp. salamae]|nr:hypothetical protein [Salmonella enterica subsp. salamae]EDW4470756.1 hypothetical protein [Salmonella enterica subsp. salamae]
MAYGRIYEITINCATGDTFTITDADVDFRCTRDSQKEPNEARLTIWGISASTQNMIAQPGGVATVAAGYQDEGLYTLFQGEISSAVTVRPAEVYGCEITLHESLIPYRASVSSRKFKTGDSLAGAVRQIAGDMGVSCRLSTNAQSLTITRPVSGAMSSRDMLDSVCKPAGAGWSLQYQTLQVSAGDALETGAADIRPETGLIGTPKLKVSTPKKHRGRSRKAKTSYQFPPAGSQVDYTGGARRQIGVIEGVSFTSLLRGGIDVGSEVMLSSPSLGKGWWVTIGKIEHQFSTRSNQPWITDFEGAIR